MKEDLKEQMTARQEKEKKLPPALAQMKTAYEVHEYYQKIIRSMPNNVYWLDKNGINRECNDNVHETPGLKSPAQDLRIKEYASNLVASSHALLELMDEVLVAGKVRADEIPLLKRKFNLTQTFEQVTSLYAAKAHEKKIDLSLNIDPEIPGFVIGDNIRLHRIVLELVANALTFTHAGFVAIDVILAKKINRQLIIKVMVRDSGIGLSKDRQQDIYLQFKKIPAHRGIYKGSGLGLYIVQQLTDELKGEIYVESDLQKGTTFTCLFPFQAPLLDDETGSEKEAGLSVENSTACLPSRPACNPKAETGCRILLVEDNRMVQLATKTILATLQAVVDIAANGEEALKRCQQKTYDLILMDIGLGEGMDGYAVTEALRKSPGLALKTPIIALTAHAGEENRKRCLKAGMNDVLTKPLTKEQAANLLEIFV